MIFKNNILRMIKDSKFFPLLFRMLFSRFQLGEKIDLISWLSLLCLPCCIVISESVDRVPDRCHCYFLSKEDQNVHLRTACGE